MAARRMSEMRDPGALFEAHSAEEIRALERKVRAEIEHKKEELRQMVGERYRDLIEAADTIEEMRRSAEQVLGAVRGLETYCGGLKAKSAAIHKGKSAVQSQERFYCMAAQIKLLLEIPEKIWSSMEASQYLHATQLYLLCCHLHSLLQLDSSTSRYSPVLQRFPILIRQVAAAGTFRSTILQESKALLKCPSVSDQAVTEALCSIMLLEDSSPRQALADFLLARKAGIQQLLNQPHHGSSIKSQVCSLVELLANTLYQAHALFYTAPGDVPPNPSLNSGLLFSMLGTVTAQDGGGKGIKVLREEMKSVGWFKHLPQSVVGFQPTLRTLAHPINQDYLRETLQQWISMCNEDIKSGISALLVYVKSLKGLAGIRDAIWELLTSESMSQNWDVVCQRLLDRPIRFWEDLMQQLFLDRLQTLIKEGLESISNDSVQLLQSSLQELEGNTEALKHTHYEGNICAFLWAENQNDLPPDAAWVSVASRSAQCRSALSLKAQAVTPCVLTFCQALDSKLKVKLEDLFSYLPQEASDQQSKPAITGLKLSAFDRYGDANTVQEMLSQHCLTCMQHIQDSVKVQLQAAAETGLASRGDGLLGSQVATVLFLARLCQSLGELCPHLKQCILGKSGSLDISTREPRSTKKTGKGKQPDKPQIRCKWQELKDKLIKQSLDAYSIWSSAVVQHLVRSFTQSLLLNAAGSALAAATHWDEIEIQEETEAGSSVVSKILLPGQCSWYVQPLLFNLCQEVNRVGGHTIPKVTLQELLRTCLEEVISAYEKLCQESTGKKKHGSALTQARALQLLFDLRYIWLILGSRSEDGMTSKSKPDSRIQQVADRLESCIDPFDLDVFTPHLNANLNRLAQRTSVLFGLLTGAESQFTSRSSTLGIQETHNVLPLASSQIGFGLLPLSMSSSRKTKSAGGTADQVKMLEPATAPQPAEDSFRPGSLFRQLATQDEDLQAPSYFKLGWLSSMTKCPPPRTLPCSSPMNEELTMTHFYFNVWADQGCQSQESTTANHEKKMKSRPILTTVHHYTAAPELGSQADEEHADLTSMLLSLDRPITGLGGQVVLLNYSRGHSGPWAGASDICSFITCGPNVPKNRDLISVSRTPFKGGLSPVSRSNLNRSYNPTHHTL
ncbi:PREDICTED: conserved oligomeric Golgi complex subunit 1 [Nanorana parkeri]|uniref:conserved oligomeric Golgi complex subunit 1 n=1 Tax=Nanorana parkeri TaxID=125878 RepID=UPI00085413D7|nr:PREDICTED: conserved oligomeric Golgi complex subunit 1 [Nanorana parkeri]